jgi:chromosome segregation ATPase
MKAIVKITLGLSVLISVSSCNLKENERLRTTVDSLQTELKTSVEVAQTLNDVGVLMDSIDLNRNALNTNMVEGTSYTNYTERLYDLNEYVKKTVKKIASLEEVVRKSKSNNSYYASTIKKLKSDLESRSLELVALQQEVEIVRAENKQLVETIQFKEGELLKRAEMIQLNQESIASLEKRVGEISTQASVDQADAYYKQAQALEIAAQRTKFAPRKKKATNREALELYKLAATLGKTEAEVRIAKLEKSI